MGKNKKGVIIITVIIIIRGPTTWYANDVGEIVVPYIVLNFISTTINTGNIKPHVGIIFEICDRIVIEFKVCPRCIRSSETKQDRIACII